jgi:VanZ family protein
LLAFLITVLYAVSDEYHQTFIFGRQGAARDVLIDSAGVLLTVWLSWKKC